jgi:hypothetical protein
LHAAEVTRAELDGDLLQKLEKTLWNGFRAEGNQELRSGLWNGANQRSSERDDYSQ